MSESLTHSIPRSFLVVALSASSVGFADALWLCPERVLRIFFASVSLVDTVTLSPLSRSVSTDSFRHWWAFRSGGGASPHALGSVVALGDLRWLHLYRLTPDLVSLRQFAVCRWSSGRCFILLLRDVPLVFNHFVSFTDLCVSLTPHSHRVMFLGHLTRRVTWLTYCPPPRSSRTLSFALTSGHDSLIPMHPAIDIVWRSLSPSLTVAMTPCNCGALGGLYVLVGPLTYPSPGRMFGPSCCGRLPCRETGLTCSTLLALPGFCLMPDL